MANLYPMADWTRLSGQQSNKYSSLQGYKTEAVDSLFDHMQPALCTDQLGKVYHYHQVQPTSKPSSQHPTFKTCFQIINHPITILTVYEDDKKDPVAVDQYLLKEVKMLVKVD